MRKILPPTAQNIQEAAHILRNSGLVVIPTETVYGLAANALCAEACEKIFALKNRPLTDPLIVHVPGLAEARNYATWDAHPALELLANTFWPGPLTIVLPKKDTIPGIVTSGQPTVALRCPDHPVTLELLRQCALPLAAPSANRFGKISPTTPAAVLEEFGENSPPILDGGACRGGIESTIIGPDPANPGALKIFRPGLITAEQIADVANAPVNTASPAARTVANDPVTPGSLPAHYCPTKPLCILRENWRTLPRQDLRALTISSPSGEFPPDRLGWLLLRGPGRDLIGTVHDINPQGNITQAAALLYSALRELDNNPRVHLILAELAPHEGIGIAINDRLLRASRGKTWSRGDSNP